MTSKDAYFRALVRFNNAEEAGIPIETQPDYAELRKMIDDYTGPVTNVNVMVDHSGSIRQKDLELIIDEAKAMGGMLIHFTDGDPREVDDYVDFIKDGASL